MVSTDLTQTYMQLGTIESKAHSPTIDSVISFEDYNTNQPVVSKHMAFEELFGTYELGQYIFGLLSARDLLNAQLTAPSCPLTQCTYQRHPQSDTKTFLFRPTY